MKGKLIFITVFAIIVSGMLVVSAKNDPYVEPESADWGDQSNPADIWSPNAAIVHAGRLESDSDIDAFTVSFTDTKMAFPLQIFVPVCGQHFADFRPSIALIGPGLETPGESLPFSLPDGMGAQVFPDDYNVNGVRIALTTNNITGEQPVYSTNRHVFSLPQAGEYTIAVWEPDGDIGAYMLSTGQGGDTFANRSNAEIDASFEALFSGAWIGQDCNAPLATCAADSAGESAKVSARSDAKGFLLTGIVRDERTCQPIPKAELRYFVLGSDDASLDGRVVTDEQGNYRIEFGADSAYLHILMSLKADGYTVAFADYTLPADAGETASFDLALQPSVSG